ncbi:hypothetical protein Tco_1343953, partial [Tanacetum coccineum]
ERGGDEGDVGLGVVFVGEWRSAGGRRSRRSGAGGQKNERRGNGG